ncbi:hypothetical protein [Streptomyces sp. AK04-3B]|uniref:hypothetical protein n=1 Tax=Streptomyces sp. AK04-3B TaxID=3028650 RepID=UPI0029AE3410|nr:hypothetical protein [Streptomyces sp. AK04-3B]MDX3800489.1 hypothetical protein [Streptomyces sp. AK04-3B]
MNTAPLVSSIAAGLGGVTSMTVGAPGRLTAGLFGCLALGLITVAVLQTLLPQESAHRLAWWRDRRRHQQLRRQTRIRPERTNGRTEAQGHDE